MDDGGLGDSLVDGFEYGGGGKEGGVKIASDPIRLNQGSSHGGSVEDSWIDHTGNIVFHRLEKRQVSIGRLCDGLGVGDGEHVIAVGKDKLLVWLERQYKLQSKQPRLYTTRKGQRWLLWGTVVILKDE